MPFCDKALCTCVQNPATIISCATVNDTACIKSQCKPKTGVCAPVALAAGTPCSDGSSCTLNDTCQGGSCAAGPNQCQCLSDADCAAKENGDLCDGQLFCDKQSGTCVLNPATVVVCPSADDTACKKNNCVTLKDAKGKPTSAKCIAQSTATGTPCNDGDPCTAGDACAGGSCASGAQVCQCKVQADCAVLEDGNVCNGTLFCDANSGQCVVNPATVVTCNSVDDTQCQKNQCDAKTGQCAVLPLPDGTLCGDNNICSAKAACSAGVCTKTAETACDDGNACTVDLCDPAIGCTHEPTTTASACDDGNPCTSDDGCFEGKCILCITKDCDDGLPCTTDICDPKTGACAKLNTPDGKACGNGLGACDAGRCLMTKSGLQYTYVPEGEAQIGCNTGDYQGCGDNEKPRVMVKLSSFWIGVSELTVAAYAACVSSKTCTVPVAAASSCTYTASGAQKQPNAPINCISPNQARTYCKSLGTGRDLPTNAQWEKAARGGCGVYPDIACANTPINPWGTNGIAYCGYANLGKCTAGTWHPVDVCSKAPGNSPYGACDMLGNVSEIVLDGFSFDTNYATTMAGKLDPLVPAGVNGHILRGLDYQSSVYCCGHVTEITGGLFAGDGVPFAGARCVFNCG